MGDGVALKVETEQTATGFPCKPYTLKALSQRTHWTM